MAKGLSFKAFAGQIGVDRKTLYNWADEHESFAEAKAIANEKCRLFWEQAGVSGMFMGKGFNATIWCANMNNRFGWNREKKKSDAPPVESESLAKLTHEQIIEIIKAAREK